jgi:hypothetical protein
LSHLVGVRRAVVEAHHLHADVAVGDQGADVDGALSVEERQVLGDGPPVLAGGGQVAVEPGGVPPHVAHRLRRRRRERDPVLADDVGRHPLADRRLVVRIDQERQVAVDVDVHEAGADDLAGGVEGRFRLGVAELPDCGDPVAADADVGAEPGQPGAVDDAAVADEQVEHGGDRGAGVVRNSTADGP